jgi:hypothetical protein
MTFVTVQNSGGDSVIVRQSFVALQPIVDVVNPLSQTLGIHQPPASNTTPAVA